MNVTLKYADGYEETLTGCDVTNDLVSGDWSISSGPHWYNPERREEMISKSAFSEALAEAGVAKNIRRKVEKLSSSDFEFLIAALLAKAFKPEMLKVFEEPVQKVKVVEEEELLF